MGEGGGDSDADNNTISLGQSGADSELKGLLVRLWSLRPGVVGSALQMETQLEVKGKNDKEVYELDL